MSAELLHQRLHVFCGAKPVGHVIREEAVVPTHSLKGKDKRYPQNKKFSILQTVVLENEPRTYICIPSLLATSHFEIGVLVKQAGPGLVILSSKPH